MSQENSLSVARQKHHALRTVEGRGSPHGKPKETGAGGRDRETERQREKDRNRKTEAERQTGRQGGWGQDCEQGIPFKVAPAVIYLPPVRQHIPTQSPLLIPPNLTHTNLLWRSNHIQNKYSYIFFQKSLNQTYHYSKSPVYLGVGIPSRCLTFKIS